MNSSRLPSASINVSTISRSDRWQAYQRLQDLGISCHCSSTGHLEVDAATPLAILQVKSVIRQLTASRVELLNWLEDCWQSKMVE